MGTRGIWGFTLDGQTKATYNHFDSYPSGLGEALIEAVSRQNPDELKTMVRGLTLVDEQAKPGPDLKKQLAEYTDLGVSLQTDDDWYCLLRHTQGDLEKTLRSRHMIDSFGFGYDSLFCEWGYIIDLDADQFVGYVGFRHEPATGGLWADGKLETSYEGGPTYGPITPFVTIDLDLLRADPAGAVAAMMAAAGADAY